MADVPDDGSAGRRYYASRRLRNFTALPNEVLRRDDLTGNAKALYAIILDIVVYQREEPDLAGLGALLGGAEKTARAAVNALVAADLLEVRRRGQGLTNAYFLLAPAGFQTGPEGGSDTTLNGPDGASRSDAEAVPSVLPENTSRKTLPPAPPAGDIIAVYEHWRLARGKGNARYDTMSPKRADKIRSRLRDGFSVEDLIKAISGVEFDPWPDRRLHDDLTVIFRSREQVEKFLDLYEQRPTAAGGLSPEEIHLRYGTGGAA